MKRIALFLFLIPMAFAAWQSVAALAMGLSLTILAIIFMIGFGFGIKDLQFMAREELFQLIALGVLMIFLVGTDNVLNSISTSPAFAQDAATMQEGARMILNDTMENVTTVLQSIGSYDKTISIESSKATQCNVFGMGYSVSGCGGFTMLSTPLSMAGGIAGFAIGELAAMQKLIHLSETYALALLLPVGIVLRTLKVTRGAGGLLIAFGISLHIMLPAGIIFNEMLAVTFLADPDASEGYEPEEATVSLPECDPGDTGTENEGAAVNTYRSMKDSIRRYLYQVLIRATLGPVISLMMMAASIRALTSIAGAEVDVTAISRFV